MDGIGRLRLEQAVRVTQDAVTEDAEALAGIHCLARYSASCYYLLIDGSPVTLDNKCALGLYLRGNYWFYNNKANV